jgi:hypothetical protein
MLRVPAVPGRETRGIVVKYAFAMAAAFALAAGSAQAGTKIGATGGGDGRGNDGQARYIPEENSDAVATAPAALVVAGRKPGVSSGTGV